MGTVISLGGEWFRNWLLLRRGLPIYSIHWWDALPLAIVLGVVFAINMYRPPFGRYD